MSLAFENRNWNASPYGRTEPVTPAAEQDAITAIETAYGIINNGMQACNDGVRHHYIAHERFARTLPAVFAAIGGYDAELNAYALTDGLIGIDCRWDVYAAIDGFMEAAFGHELALIENTSILTNRNKFIASMDACKMRMGVA
ncbi:hypothetical protein [Litorimonas sp.]|uniref:hypothetical protein n=1 Tax=Litorimonas sp. TaxID=1892381 RepID=UPI003A848D55